MEAAIRQGPDGFQHKVRPLQVTRNSRSLGWVAKEGRDGKPEQAGPRARAGDQRMIRQVHQLLASGFRRSLDEHRPDGVDAEKFSVLLLLLDELVIGPQLF